MKTVVAVDLKNKAKGFEFKTRFLGIDFHILCIRTGGDIDFAAQTLKKWNGQADALAVESFPPLLQEGPQSLLDRQHKKINAIGDFFDTPFSTGQSTLAICQKWTINHLQQDFRDNFFDNADILFISGMTDNILAKSLLEYTDNLKFLDPVYDSGIPRILTSLEDLKLYAEYMHPFTAKVSSRKIAEKVFFINACNEHLISSSIKKTGILVVPHYSFFEDIGDYGIDELEGKTVITHAISTDMLNFLKQRGVDLIIDTIPKIAEKVIGPGILEAMIMVATESNQHTITRGDMENTIISAEAKPRIIYPFQASSSGKSPNITQ